MTLSSPWLGIMEERNDTELRVAKRTAIPTNNTRVGKQCTSVQPPLPRPAALNLEPAQYI